MAPAHAKNTMGSRRNWHIGVPHNLNMQRHPTFCDRGCVVAQWDMMLLCSGVRCIIAAGRHDGYYPADCNLRRMAEERIGVESFKWTRAAQRPMDTSALVE